MKKHGKRITFKLATMAILAGIIALAALLLPGIAVAAEAMGNTPAGLWKTIDDKNGKPRSLVRITENDGELTGKIEKLFRSPERDQDPKCVSCSGALKDQPIIGMTVLSGLKKESDGSYGGGQIIDPSSGKTYKSKLSVIEDGKKLNVRGYIGLPVLGRTQVWLREE